MGEHNIFFSQNLLLISPQTPIDHYIDIVHTQVNTTIAK